MRELAAQGLSILFTSSEMEEARLLADRVLVMARGSIVADIASRRLTDEALFAAASSCRWSQVHEKDEIRPMRSCFC